MANCYNLDGIKTSLKIEIEEREAILKAWENVTFPTKKDEYSFLKSSILDTIKNRYPYC